MLRRCTLMFLLSLLALFSCAAAAQSPAEPPRVSIGAGLGLAVPYHGDFDFTPWAWDADVRLRLSRRVMLEVAGGEWRHDESNVFENIPYGATGQERIGRLETTLNRRMQMVQANVLGRLGSPRVAAVLGGGVGFLHHTRDTRSLSTNCTPGAVCGDVRSDFSSSMGTGQGVGGIEARVAGGLYLQGNGRFIVPFDDPGGMELRLTAGIRWGF